jgi:hypothetical protein
LIPDHAAWSPADWSALGTMITALVAVVAAGFAWAQVRHARKLREEQAKPYVVVGFEPSPVWANAINLYVENIGSTVASDVQIRFDRPLESKVRTEDINDSKLFREGISTMPPGMRLETLFDLTHERYDTDLPMAYQATVSYLGLGSRREETIYTLDMGIYYGLEGFEAKGMHQVAKSVDTIAQLMKKWTGSRGRLNVWVKDEDYQRWSDNWQRERGGDTPSLGVPFPAGRRTPSPYDYLDESSSDGHEGS